MEKKLLIMKAILQNSFFTLKEQKNLASIVAVISLVSLFDFLFYRTTSLGVNGLIMSVFTLGLAIVIHQPSLNNRIFWWTVFGSLFSGINITYNGDTWSYSLFFLSHFLAIGSIHTDNQQNIIMVIFQWLLLQFTAPFYTIYFLLQHKNWESYSYKKIHKMAKIGFIPIILSTVFISLYGFANEEFYTFLIDPIVRFSSSLSIDFIRLCVWVFAAIIIVPLMIPVQNKGIILKSFRPKKTLTRLREKGINRNFKMNALRQEVKISTVSLIMLNVFLFLFNSLDIFHVWAFPGQKSAVELSQYVHDGTNITIISIVLGTALLLVFFRKNINFYKNNIKLKRLATIWVAQNVFMASSTFMRNYHYVNEYGLTYRRLGVVIFLTLVIIGLVFTYQKIISTHTIGYFFNRMCLASYLVLLGYSLIDHQSLIIHHATFVQKENVDIYYLESISNNHDFLLYQYKEQLESKSHQQIKISFPAYNKYKNWTSYQYLDRKNTKVLQKTEE